MARPKQKRRGKKKAGNSSSTSSNKGDVANKQPSTHAKKDDASKSNESSSPTGSFAETAQENSTEMSVEPSNGESEEGEGGSNGNGSHDAAIEADDEKKLVEKDAPALIEILEAYQDKISLVEKQLKGGVQKVIEDAEEEKIDTNDGISLLEAKYQVMLSYCIRICFYLLMKLTGKSINKSKLPEQQAHLRTLLDKLRPIDKKIKYQISQLLRTAAMDAQGLQQNEDGANPLAFRPSPGKLLNQQDGGGEGGTDGSTAGLYKPPQVNPMEMATEDKKDKKKAKRARKMREKAASNAVIKTMKEMLSTAPEEVDIGGGGNDEIDAKLVQREKFEEDNFVRLQEKRKEKAARKKKEQERSAIDNVADLDEFVNIMKSATESKSEDAEGREELAALRREKALKAMGKGGGEGGGGGRKRKLEDEFAAGSSQTTANSSSTASSGHSKKKNRGGPKKKKKKQRR